MTGLHARFLMLLVLAAVGCDGQIGGMGEDGPLPDGPPGDPPPMGEELIGGHHDAAPGLRRLTPDEYRQSVQSLIGVQVTASLPSEAPTYLYERVRESATVSPLHVESWLVAAEEASAAFIEDEGALAALPCAREVLPPQASERIERTAAELGVTDCSHCIRPTGDGSVDVYYTANGDGQIGVYLAETFEEGIYELTLRAHMSSSEVSSIDIRVELDGAPVTTFGIGASEPTDYRVQLDMSGGPHRIEFFAPSALYGVGHVYLHTIQLETFDPGAVEHADARAACLRDFAQDLSSRAFRGPGDATPYLDVAMSALEAGGFWHGLGALIEAVLVSPRFLYLVEEGESTDTDGFHRLTGHELAGRLALTYWGDLPDQELVTLANDGSLLDPTVVAEQTERLMADERARTNLQRFYAHWLKLDDLHSLTRSVAVFPEFDEPTRAAMIAESYGFVERVLWNEDGGISDLLLSRDATVPEGLAHIYGVPAGSELPAERAGLLTQPAFLALTSAPNQTNPVYRGHFVLSRLLCREMHIPQGLNVAAPAPDPSATTRERFGAHSSDASCAGCHQTLDPIGFAFESFDGIGRHRTEEHGLPVDDSGGLPPLGIPDGSLNGAVEIAEALAEAPEVAMCAARQWFRFAMGRLENDRDVASLDAIRTALEDGSFRDMIAATSATPSFQHRIETPEVTP